MGDVEIRSLSLRDPWTYAVTDLEKRIENRRWNTSVRGTFAIHLATGCTTREETAVLAQMRCLGFDPSSWPGRANRPRGHIVALATLIDVVPPGDPDGDATIMAHRKDPRWWLREQWGFVLGRVVKLPNPFPCVGALGFFSLTNLVGPFQYPRMNPADYAALVRFAKEQDLGP